LRVEQPKKFRNSHLAAYAESAVLTLLKLEIYFGVFHTGSHLALLPIWRQELSTSNSDPIDLVTLCTQIAPLLEQDSACTITRAVNRTNEFNVRFLLALLLNVVVAALLVLTFHSHFSSFMVPPLDVLWFVLLIWVLIESDKPHENAIKIRTLRASEQFGSLRSLIRHNAALLAESSAQDIPSDIRMTCLQVLMQCSYELLGIFLIQRRGVVEGAGVGYIRLGGVDPEIRLLELGVELAGLCSVEEVQTLPTNFVETLVSSLVELETDSQGSHRFSAEQYEVIQASFVELILRMGNTTLVPVLRRLQQARGYPELSAKAKDAITLISQRALLTDATLVRPVQAEQRLELLHETVAAPADDSNLLHATETIEPPEQKEQP
jgi:hypothetical protein